MTTDDTTPAPKRTGRPRKAAPELRTERLPAPRVTPDERAAFDREAAAAGLLPSDYARQLWEHRGGPMRRRAAPKAQAATEAAAIVALNRIGVLLNQITKRLNASGRVSPHLDAVLDQVQAAVERLAGPPR